MRIKDNPLCNFCRSDIDTYSNAFYDCLDVRIFWNEIELWMRERTQDDITLTTVETVICNPSRDLNEKVAYDRGSLNTVSIQQSR